MQKTFSSLSQRSFAVLVSIIVLGLLLAYTYAFLFRAPYAGFFYDPSSGKVITLYVKPHPGAVLEQGDVLKQIGLVSWDQYFSNPSVILFNQVKPGQIVEITVQRDEKMVTVPWVFPGFNREEFISRFFNNWWLGYFFWFFGMITWIFMRPKDIRWRLLIAANYLMALWLVIGNLSGWQIWGSSLLLHAITWIMLPVFLHFHWVFPRPLGRVSRYIGWALYGVSVFLAVGQLIAFIPAFFYLVGFILSLIGSITLLIIHYVRQADQRKEIGILAIALAIAILPSIALAISGIFGSIPRIALLALLALPIMPGAYVYATFRRHLGGMELRANRTISLIVYEVLLMSLTIPIAFVFNSVASPGVMVTSGLLFVLVLGLVTALVYPSFQRWIEHRLLGMAMPSDSLLETYMARITTSIERERLNQVICEDVLPSLLIRQAALLRLEDENHYSLVCMLGIATNQLPGQEEIPALLAESGKVRFFNPENAQPCPWVHLVLSLKLTEKPIGLCLLGRRDPDDYYAASEIPTLQALMDQSALAIINIEQSEHLHALYKADIERQEVERNQLAYELHDDVLGQMALLMMNTEKNVPGPQFDQTYQAVTQHLRQIVSGLRPTMLNYGLWSALDELVDGFEITGNRTPILMELLPNETRYPQVVELHLFRIVQQACQNALQHADARVIRIAGSLQPACVDLVVEDDGVGFAAGEKLDLPGLLASKHFGLAGMYERAALIGAKMTVESIPGTSTRVRVTWQASP